MSLHKENAFESEVCDYLSNHGWLYEVGDAQKFDRTRALYPPDVVAWVQQSQPKAWEILTKKHPANAETILLDRIRKQMNQVGTLDVLRHGVDVLGLPSAVLMAQFKPALGMNPELQARYAANRLRVIRQVRYSVHNENSIDLVLCLNGVPVCTTELKTDFTQSVEDAVDQYRFDRNPKPKGKAAEPLLSFPSGALVHFAVSNSEVWMTTRLAGPETRFLPFNRGDNGGKGNPVNTLGHRTAYLWEHVWARESWLEILGRYLIAQRNEKKQIETIIFPRFHQLDATRKLVSTVLSEGPGGKYLIQHSAGSGKTNTIAWTAHFFADLHDANHQKLFDTVLVVSDRNVLDAQLQEAIFSFERTTGVVAVITGKEGSKSGELAQALAGGKKIVVCTIQTFPFALQEVMELSATHGKRFAVIADEAHSSQTGEAASKLKQVLTTEELEELKDGGEVSTEDILAAQMAARAKDAGITYVALTATPKAKTLELFGRRPDPSQPAGPANLPQAFHVYSMRQAIEEGFILDVLKNYTAYKVAFRLAHAGRDFEDTEVEREAALKGIMRWVRLHPYNISQKVQIVVEHFRENVMPLLDGTAKAMVVVGSRLEAVRWKLAIESYIQNHGYPIGTLAAFSGEVRDSESGPEPFTEKSANLNPGLMGRDIRDAFGTEEYQILLVANKFQTGFDQPLLCGMYVDKRLSGIQAVQTLSRLNRAYPGKDTTYILDFVNEPDEILASFQPYYETAELSGVTDPDLVYSLRSQLDATGYYDENSVNRVAKVELDPNAQQSELEAALEPVADRPLKQYQGARKRLLQAQSMNDADSEQKARDEMDSLVLFRRNMGTYVRVYAFLSQIFDYGNTEIEKRAIFFRRLIPLLEFGREREDVDLSKVKLTHHSLRHTGTRQLNLGGETGRLKPLEGAGSGEVHPKEKALLREIIHAVNDLFDGDVTEDDKVLYFRSVRSKLLESEILIQQAENNTRQQFESSPDLPRSLDDALIDAMAAHDSLSRQALASPEVRAKLLALLLGPGDLYGRLRSRGAGAA